MKRNTIEITPFTRVVNRGNNRAAKALGIIPYNLSRWISGKRAADPAFVKPAAKLGITFPRVREKRKAKPNT